MMKHFTLGLLGMTLSNAAFAGGFEPKTMQDHLASQSIKRFLVLGKGWIELETGFDYKNTTQAWTDTGGFANDSAALRDFDGAEWTYSSQSFNISYGVSRRVEINWKLKTHYVHLTNSELGTDNDQFGLGDPEFGFKYDLFRAGGENAGNTQSLIVYSNYKAPLANEAPGNYVGGPNTFNSFIFTTGTQDIVTGLRGKQQVGPLAVTAGVGYAMRFSGLALWAIETDQNQFNMRVKPGDELHLDAQLDLQFGPVFLSGGAFFKHRQAFKIGTTSEGLFPSKNLNAIEGSDGWSLDANAGIGLNIFNNFDIYAGAIIPLRGEDLQFFPLEDVHPTYGNVYSGSIAYRF